VKKNFAKLVRAREVEVIEVKRTLNRGVVGQAVVGAVLFQMEFKPRRVRQTVVVGKGEKGIERACRKLRINVWKAGK